MELSASRNHYITPYLKRSSQTSCTPRGQKSKVTCTRTALSGDFGFHQSSPTWVLTELRSVLPMLSLPDFAGPYKVGATTFSLPLQSPSVIGSAKLRHGKEGLRPALSLEEVAFTAFYPADISGSTGLKTSSMGLDWLIRCVVPHNVLVSVWPGYDTGLWQVHFGDMHIFAVFPVRFYCLRSSYLYSTAMVFKQESIPGCCGLLFIFSPA